MKNFIFVIFTVIILLPSIVTAQLDPSQARWNIAKKAGGCSLGIAAGVVNHELGHQITAKISGVDMDWNGTEWYAADASASELRMISVSGFGAQVLSSEVMLRTKAIPKNNSFVLCWLGYNIVRQITYPIQNELSSDGYGDLATYGRNGGKVEYLELGLILHAIWTGYRIYNNPDTPIYFRATGKEIGIGFKVKF